MTVLNILPKVFIVIILFFIFVHQNLYFVMAVQISVPSAEPNETENIIEIPYSGIVLLNEISFLEQNRLVLKKLRDEGFKFNSSTISTCHLASNVVNYLSQTIEKERKITELATLLLRPLGEYGSEKGEEIEQAQKMSVIHDWLKRSILGMSFYDWIVNEVRKIKLKKSDSLLIHNHFRNLFFDYLHTKTENGELSLDTEQYYLKNLLKDDMPSFHLNTSNNKELIRLQNITLNEPAFGFIHVGLKVLVESQLDSESISDLDEIEDIGILIEYLIHQGSITYIELFELPAKIYYVSTLDANLPLGKSWGFFYEDYFNQLKLSNPFIRLMEPIYNWKNRSTLAREVLKKNDFSEENILKAYLYNGHTSNEDYPNSRGELVTLPSIDNIFYAQNKNVSKSFQELDKLMLRQIFNKTNLDTQEFLNAAEINLVRARLLNDRIKWGVVFTEDELHYDSIVKNLGEDNIDLLMCKIRDQERVYLLNVNSYELHRVDRDRKKILNLYKDTDPGLDYKLDIQTMSVVKKKEESTDIFISKLSEIHEKKIYETLNKIGYEATLRQKIKEFLLNLIPFYTCVTELNMGNTGDAVLPCTVDIIGLIPFIGQGFKIAYKVGSSSVEASLQTLRLAAKQATVYQKLHQVNRFLTTEGIHHMKKTMNLQVFRTLGLEFLRGVDPGIGLLKLGGAKTIRIIKKISQLMKKEFPKLEKFSKQLTMIGEKILHPKSLLPAETSNAKMIVKLPDTRLDASVIKIPSKDSEFIMVRVDPETNIPFGKKYVLDFKTVKIDLSPISIFNKKFQLKIHNFKKGICDSRRVRRQPNNVPCLPLAGAVGRSFAKWEDYTVPLTTQTRINVVYRVDNPARHAKILSAGSDTGGCKPRRGLYNYNLDEHSNYFRIDNLHELGTEETSPFVFTYSNLEAARKHGKNWESLEDAKFAILNGAEIDEIVKHPDDILAYVYKVKPSSNFFNVRESYLAAREVSRPGSQRYEEINSIIEKYGDSDDYAALNGFDKYRIIEYAPIRRSDDGITELQWSKNPFYNSQFDNDWSAEDLYTQVAIRRPQDTWDMATNMVQQTLSINKVEANRRLALGLEGQKITELVTCYNFNKNEQIQRINNELREFTVRI